MRRKDQSPRTEQTHAPADSAVNPGLVQPPADEKAVLVIEEVGLYRQHPAIYQITRAFGS